MRALSIMYHDVVEGDDFDSSGLPGPAAATYKLDRADFKAHLAAIGEVIQGKAVSLADRRWDGDCPLFLTFDDGGVSASDPIAGMLEAHGWRGHLFITTGRIGTPGFVSADQIRDLRRRGHVIGSHSCSHPTRMSHCSWDELLREWRVSKDVLSRLLGEEVTMASVPGGFYSRKVGEAAAKAGIRILFTSEPTTRIHRVGNLAVLGRYVVQRGMPPQTSASLAAGRWRPRASQAALWTCKKAAKAAGGSMYLALRELVLSR